MRDQLALLQWSDHNDALQEMLKADQEFEGMDTNNFAGKGGAGVISKDEWVEQHGGSLEGFDEYDLNHDGVIDQDEYRIGKIGDKTFAGMDTNADHKISKEEWAAKHGGDTAGFDEYDLNRDGEVSQAEYRAVNAAKLQVPTLHWLTAYGCLCGAYVVRAYVVAVELWLLNC